nr:MAG TPA: hypothetical protein [Caudoviricetes sp.]
MSYEIFLNFTPSPQATVCFSAGAGRQALPARTGLARPRSKK